MKCPKCHHENPEDAAFCNGCGHKLELTCPEYGKVNPPGSRFCNGCGQVLRAPKETSPIDYSEPQSYTPKHLADKILTSRSSLEGERKLVTVLFADVAGYTAMSEKLDPEEVKEIMSRIFGEIAQVVTKYEGFIEKFIGDAVMALFGVPKAHEDDPVRTILAAREIHDPVEGMSQT